MNSLCEYNIMHNQFSPSVYFIFDVPRSTNHRSEAQEIFFYISNSQAVFQGSFGKRQAKINVIKDVNARKKYTA